jgi:predicted transcriptional regulator
MRSDPRLLYDPLRARALERVELALKVAVLVRLGCTRGEIADRLGVTTRDVRDTIGELQDVAAEIELGDRPGDELD